LAQRGKDRHGMAENYKLRALIGPNPHGAVTVVELRREPAPGTALAQGPGLPDASARFLDAALRGRALLRAGDAPLEGLAWGPLMAMLVQVARRAGDLADRAAIIVDAQRCITVPVEDRTLGRAIVELALALHSWGLQQGPAAMPGLATMVEGFSNQVAWLGFSQQGLVIAEGCARLGVPFRRHSTLEGHYIVGEGRDRLVMIASDTERTASMGKETADAKDLANELLAKNGLPVAAQRVVTTAADAWKAARHIGPPVVIKPRLGRQGKGVSLDVRSQADAEAAFALARAQCEQVLVEATLPGDDHRIMVVNGQVPIVLHRVAPTISGDGTSTIGALIDAFNRAGGYGESSLEGRADTERLLASRKQNLDTVLPAGEIFAFRTVPDGTWPRSDVSAAMHPDNRDMLARTAAVFGLDVASVDLRCPDIARSWREVGGGICEVETASGLMAVIRADATLVDRFFGALLKGRRLRMHHVAICAVHAELATADLLARGAAAAMAKQHGWAMALASSQGLWLDGYRVGREAMAPVLAYLHVAESPLIDAAVYVCPVEMALSQGLGVELPSLAIILESSSANHRAKAAALRYMLEKSGIAVANARTAQDAEALVRALQPLPPFAA
jgi:cyanophycin synthetase